MSDHGFNNCTSTSNDVSTVNIDCSSTAEVNITGTVKIIRPHLCWWRMLFVPFCHQWLSFLSISAERKHPIFLVGVEYNEKLRF